MQYWCQIGGIKEAVSDMLELLKKLLTYSANKTNYHWPNMASKDRIGQVNGKISQ